MLDPELPVPPLAAIRPEHPGDPGDAEAIRAVHLAAFPTADEADLVDQLRATGELDPERSLLAVVEGEVVGHCLLTATILEHPDGSQVRGRVLALGPIGVLPTWQRRHVGTTLMHAALERSVRDGAAAVVLVGSPTYYARFGFAPARAQGLLPPGHWRDEIWMARLLPAWTPADAGVVRYARPFLELP